MFAFSTEKVVEIMQDKGFEIKKENNSYICRRPHARKIVFEEAPDGHKFRIGRWDYKDPEVAINQALTF
ncbi:MAG: hypothetical protein CVU99_02640 [Firmicutes bacterium HGW-Firmicutes-4]|jgi:hypothetical protein|nr:MAG: hypothetical protein CVU99_02640 [Firmicutes bacterium HGW-Firmicutes-4]